VFYLSTNWIFTLPLIMDKQMDFWPAMQTSWKMVNKHWWQVFGLIVLMGLLNIAGLLACCVGIFFTIPIGLGAWMYAYETIFSRPQTG
jgi:membrane-anchored glycerophosphoryl diester phosphodiesterase (GDPDase)